MDFYERFRPALVCMRDNWIMSLPLCNRKEEVLFLYTTVSDGNKKKHIVPQGIISRKRDSGELEEIATDKLLEKCHEMGSFEEREYSCDLTDLLNSRREYWKLYDDFCLFSFSEEITEEQRKICKRLLEIINLLVTSDVLLECYKEIGKEYFEYLQTNAG